GITETMPLNELFKKILKNCDNYDSLSLVYCERGTNVILSADIKNVKMNSKEVTEDDFPTASSSSPAISKTVHTTSNTFKNLNETSTLLNRNYYIKVGKADSLLKEIGIMTKDGKIKNDKIRKYNQIDHYVELLEGILEKLPQNQTINILDCGCGKSYLTFVLNYYLTEVKRKKCHFIGLDYSKSVIDASRKMAENLNYRNMEFHALDINDYKPDKTIHVVISLHACDTATDMALALGIKVSSEVIIAVPCCHKEILSQYSFEPFKEILKHGIFKARMADVLTDGMRSMLLEAKGYDVSVVEYISPLETPKNLMIRAVKVKGENSAAIDEYTKLMQLLNVYPSLYAYLNNFEYEED
ncbi:MAG: SAM-dependent methyltransferase, partial [Bacillota bacterium]|nr:SAM-dependent methyltransferase [Bacillota bacterium]